MKEVNKIRNKFLSLGYQVETKKNRVVIKKNKLNKYVCYVSKGAVRSACNKFLITDHYEKFDQ